MNLFIFFFFLVQHLRFQNVTAHFAHSYQAIMVMKTRYFTWTGQFTLPQRSLKLLKNPHKTLDIRGLLTCIGLLQSVNHNVSVPANFSSQPTSSLVNARITGIQYFLSNSPSVQLAINSYCKKQIDNLEIIFYIFFYKCMKMKSCFTNMITLNS